MRRPPATCQGAVPPVTEPSHAVFLSYASQDAEPAQKICEALRAAGIEVFLDQSELRGGDAWDQKIRREIHDCALFIPVISANTASRHEGYFRLEWDLADQRTHMIARSRVFVVPVCLDATTQVAADVPESFQRAQWTRLPGGETPSAFVERVKRLLSPEILPAVDAARSAGTASASVAPAEPTLSPSGLPRRRMGWLYGAIGAAVLLALGYLGLERLRGSRSPVQSTASIAVLPLANESGEASQQYFSDGISEDVITALGQFPGLKVIGRSSAFQFRDSKEDSRSIGTKLGVAHLLEGSVRKSGDMIRVSAELIDTTDGSMQWSEHYDRPYKDLFALQDEITNAVVAALKTKLVPGEHAAAQSERPPGGSLEAYDAMLQGRSYFWHVTEADNRKAIESLTRATQLDPRYALAWSWLSQAWLAEGTSYAGDTPFQALQPYYAKGREMADRAIDLAPDLAVAHFARAALLQAVDMNWHAAEGECRRALALAPNDGLTKICLAAQLATFGETEPAIDLTRQALATEPLQAAYYNVLASYLLGLNRLDEAERALRRSIELQPNAACTHYLLTVIEVQRGNAQAALEAAQQETPGFWQNTALALARQIGGDRSAADASLRTLIDKDAGIAPYQIAQVYALRNDANETFAWLDRAWSSRDGAIGYLLHDPFILRYKDDPRFAAFCRKVGLPTPAEIQRRT
jgi:TolB-like protein/tetratricopeptide (TPR) repeat protein